MSHYLRVFNFLWRAKRMEYTLTDIWKGQMCNAKLLKTMPGMLYVAFLKFNSECGQKREGTSTVFLDLVLLSRISMWIVYFFWFYCLHCVAKIPPEWSFNDANPFYLQNCQVCCTNVTSWRLRWSTSFTRCSTTSPLRSGYTWLQLLLRGCKPSAEIPIIITAGAKMLPLLISTLTPRNKSPPNVSVFTSLVSVQSKLKVRLMGLFQMVDAHMIHAFIL